MKITSKTKILFIVIPVLVLMGAFFLQKLDTKRHVARETSLPSSPNPNFKEKKTAQNKCSTHKDGSKVELVHLRKKPPQIPSIETSQKESVVEDWTSNLEMPSPITDHELDIIIYRQQANLICYAQDKVMRTWPTYKDIQPQLYKELLTRFDLENMSNEELIQTSLELRKNFWQTGGNVSKTSYSHAYEARIILELAHNREPENLAITDELVETILSVELEWRRETDPIQTVWNNQYQEILLPLRSKQFEQVKKETKEERTPTWEDFVRANDFALLLGKSEKYESAKEVVKWLIHQADIGEWTAYIQPLERSLGELSQDNMLEFNIYWAYKSAYPEEFNYTRRLPSFKGPNPELRGVRRLDRQNSNPIWSTAEEAEKMFD